jgi:hypothetical protein
VNQLRRHLIKNSGFPSPTLFQHTFRPLPEAKAALEEFLHFLAESAALAHAGKITIGEAYKLCRRAFSS